MPTDPALAGAGCFEAIVHDLGAGLQLAEDRAAKPTAVVLDSRTVQSTPESDRWANYCGGKRRTGSRVHAVVNTLDHLIALRITPARASGRDHVTALVKAVKAATGD